MTSPTHPARRPRRDGWTPERRRQFLDLLAAGLDVRRAAGRVGMARETAYRLRRREAGFARGWDEALRAAKAADEQAFLALLARRLPRIMAAVSGARSPQAPGRTSSQVPGQIPGRA